MGNQPSSDNSLQTVTRVTVAGLCLNLFLLAFKLWAGVMGGSKAVMADAFHTLTDLSTDLAIIFGVKWWMRPPDEDHPYGHQRIEAVVTLFVGSVLGVVAVWLAVDGIRGLRQVHDSSPRVIALVATLVSIVSKELMYRFTVSAGHRTKSRALLANAWHHRSDALSSVPVLVAVAVAMFFPKYAFIDHVGELLVSVIILGTAYKILRSALAELSDGTASAEDQESIESVARAITGVKDVHAVRSRKVGPGLHVDLHVLVDGDDTVRAGHDVASQVKHALLEKGPSVIDAVVHIEPYDSERDYGNPE